MDPTEIIDLEAQVYTVNPQDRSQETLGTNIENNNNLSTKSLNFDDDNDSYLDDGILANSHTKFTVDDEIHENEVRRQEINITCVCVCACVCVRVCVCAVNPTVFCIMTASIIITFRRYTRHRYTLPVER
jgi:hypothetical protein